MLCGLDDGDGGSDAGGDSRSHTQCGRGVNGDDGSCSGSNGSVCGR